MKPLPPKRNGVRNRLLGHLPAEDFGRLRPHLERLDCQPRAALYEPHQRFEHVHFPETGVGSIVSVLADGTQTEVATVGPEGVVGLAAFFGVDAVPYKAFWQLAGSAWRLPVATLRREAECGGALRETL